MTKEECHKLVLDIIADIAPDEDLANVKPDVRLRDQLQLDSMDFLDIVMELRKRYRVQIPAEDRWAIILYVRALQRSQNATMKDVPEELRKHLKSVEPNDAKTQRVKQ